MHSRCALMRRARAAIELRGPKALFRRSGCVCAGFTNKCTRKLRVNYGVNDAGPGPCHGTTVPTVGTCWYRRYGTTYGTVP